jgi:dipeptidyl aminopeptidase/acylaminoacyl peptidase
MQPRHVFRLHFAVFAIAVCAWAQAGKRPLALKDADNWRSIQSQILSPDGRWLAYGLFPQEGDGQAVAREVATAKELRENAGTLPPPPEDDPFEFTPREERQTAARIRLAFTAGGRFLVSSTYPSKAETDEAKKQKKKPEEMPKNGIVVFDLGAGKTTRVGNVRSFQVSERGAAMIAWLKEGKPEDAPRGRARRDYGSELILLDPVQGKQRSFADVLEFSLSKDGAMLVYAVASRKVESNGVFAVATRDGAEPAALLAGKGKYSKLTWDLKQTRLAFLSDRDDQAAKLPRSRLYLWERGAAVAAETVSTASPGFHSGWVFSERGAMSFTRDGARLFAACAPMPARPEADAAAAGEEKVLADLWHWRDPFIQPMQRIRAAAERARSYRAVYHLAAKRFLQLADETMPQLAAGDDGRWAIGGDDRAYRSQVDFDGAYSDYYLVDTETGQRVKFCERCPGGFGGNPAAVWSPDGRAAIFFRDRHWHAVSAAGGAVRNLTAGLQVNFFNEENDTPGAAQSYGHGGWTRDGKFALLYDRFDVWKVSPDGAAADNITRGLGRRQNLRFRAQRLEPDEEDEPRGIDPARPVTLRAESLDNYDSGFWQARLDGQAAPQKLVMAAKDFTFRGKAKEAGTVLVTATRFDEPPDLWVTDASFGAMKKASDANPRRGEFLWGTGELIAFKNADGVPLKAALFKPENFDPNKKYPLMVYIYERLSQGVHSFVEPRPGTSINRAIFVSNGYLVLTPDIVYTVGAPGESALKCVLPAIQAVVDRGYVDENAIGIQGHSWGGYQIAYMVGHTRRFRAAEAGAPVGNMTSAYNGIRWGSGLPRQFQYEKTQSRIGGPLWERPLRYIENSPVFFADRVSTPLLILHNDQDDAVPWYQGIELYLSLRRNGKEVYLFCYNGEKHGIRKRINQKDYSLRMIQFFDHFLKGAPKPEWMERGIPYLERDEEKEKFKAVNGQ